MHERFYLTAFSLQTKHLFHMTSTDHITPSIFFTLPFVIFNALLLFAALLYGLPDASFFAGLLLVLYLGIRAWSLMGPHKVTCACAVDREALFPGETLSFTAQVRNGKLLPVFVKLRPHVRALLPSGEDRAAVSTCVLLGYQGVTFDYALVARRRGIYPLGVPVLTTGDFFGLFPRQKQVDRHLEVVVYPRLIPLKPFPLLKRILFGKPGVASPVSDPVYILGTRAYQGQRPARHIHWKASARLGRLQEKICEPAEQAKVLLILDGDRFSSADNGADFEKTIEVIASLAAELVARHYAVGFMTNCPRRDGLDNRPAFGHSAVSLPALLRHLAALDIEPAQAMSAYWAAIQNLPRDMTCVYFTRGPREAAKNDPCSTLPTLEIQCAGAATARDAAAPDTGCHLADFLI